MICFMNPRVGDIVRFQRKNGFAREMEVTGYFKAERLSGKPLLAICTWTDDGGKRHKKAHRLERLSPVHADL